MAEDLAEDLAQPVAPASGSAQQLAIAAAEHEVGLLTRHLERYPHLLEACAAFSQARDTDVLARTLLQVAENMVPEWRGGRVDLVADAEPSLVNHSGDVPTTDIQLISYVIGEDRHAVQRTDHDVLVVLPLRSHGRWRDELPNPAATSADSPESPQQADSSSAQSELDSQPHRSAQSKPYQARGALSVLARSRGTEDVLMVDGLRALAGLAGLGLAAVDLVDQARSLALHDDLTGLFGRLEFFRRLREMMAAASRAGQTVGVIMCDMDHLKRVNDTWGHSIGDQTLRSVATVIRDTLPHGAIACRYGGEEFAIAVPAEFASGTLHICDTLVESIRRSMPVPELPELQVTASLGWALTATPVVPPRADGATDVSLIDKGPDLVALADAACYRAKQAGRDRVEAGGTLAL